MATILVDMDGVVADLETSILAHLKKWYPEAVENNSTSWFYEDRFTDIPKHAFMDFFTSQRAFRDLGLIEGAREGVDQLVEAGHDVWFCSTPVISDHCASEKYRWIEEHFPNFRRKLILSKDKTMVHGDYLIDDKNAITGVRDPTWTHVLYHKNYFTWDHTDWLLKEITIRSMWEASTARLRYPNGTHT